MNKFTVIPDTSCDLSAEMRKRLGIEYYVRGVVAFPDGHSEYADLDWQTISSKDYYNGMRSKKSICTTSAPNPDEIAAVFEKAVSTGSDVLFLSLSSGLSISYQNAVKAANMVQGKHPERKIICIDTLRYSSAVGLLTALACQKRDEGASIEDTAAYLNEIRHCVHQVGTMDDLFFLCKTGRISNFTALFGTLVGVNSMADFNRSGKAEVIAKFKGKKTAFEAGLHYVEKTVVNPQDQVLFLAHSNREDAVKLFAQMLKDRFGFKDIYIADLGMACGASIGPGLCAAFYIGNPISEDMSVEKEYMNEIGKLLKEKKEGK